jgi:Holliday junction DNA helicase RuvA
MISFLKGEIVRKSPTELVIDVNGIGYSVTIPLSTFEKFEKSEGVQTILTHMHVREDAMQLFGFATEGEREIFRLLISISGIGPKMAQGILSGVRVDQLRTAIIEGNIGALTAISGVGKKTAERIIIELRDKLGTTEMTTSAVIPSSLQLKARSEALIALMSLGHSRATAEQALRIALNETPNGNLPVEELIRLALRHTSK